METKQAWLYWQIGSKNEQIMVLCITLSLRRYRKFVIDLGIDLLTHLMVIIFAPLVAFYLTVRPLRAHQRTTITKLAHHATKRCQTIDREFCGATSSIRIIRQGTNREIRSHSTHIKRALSSVRSLATGRAQTVGQIVKKSCRKKCSTITKMNNYQNQITTLPELEWHKQQNVLSSFTNELFIRSCVKWRKKWCK